MSNRERAEVPVTLYENDTPRPLNMRYDMNALATLEELTGRTITEFAQMSENGASSLLGIKFLRAALFAGLTKQYPKMTLEGLGDMMRPADLAEYAGAVAQGISLAMGVDPGNESSPLDNGGPVPQSPGTGDSYNETPSLPDSNQIDSGL